MSASSPEELKGWQRQLHLKRFRRLMEARSYMPGTHAQAKIPAFLLP